MYGIKRFIVNTTNVVFFFSTFTELLLQTDIRNYCNAASFNQCSPITLFIAGKLSLPHWCVCSQLRA